MSKHCEGCRGFGAVQVGEPNNMGVRAVDRRSCPGISDEAEQRVIAIALEISNAYPAIRRVPASIDNWDGEEIPAYLSPAAAMVNAVLIAKLRIALGLVDLEQP